MTAKDLLLKIKGVFDAPPAVNNPADTTPADTTGAASCSYLVDGGGTIYVNISDDGIPDIDSGDKVYSDPALTVPYADGAYKVTGTEFGFTVVAGAVTDVQDAAGTGPGAPIGDPNAMAAPATTTVPPAAATPTIEQRVKAVEEALAAMKAPAAMVSQEDFIAQEKVITKHETTIKSMFELIEMLVKEPTADPVTLTGAKKEKFDKKKQSEDKFQRILESLKKTSKDKKY